PSSAVEVLDLTSDDVVTSLPGKDSAPFSSPVVSFFPRKDGRPRRSTSVASELRMRESLGKELADDDFMLGLTAEGSVADSSADTSAFVPAATVVSRTANARKLTATTERFLEPGFAAVGAQKVWCQILNGSLSESAPKDHVSPLDFAFLALMYNVHSARHPWRVLFDRMPDEPLTFKLGKLVQGVRISIRASGHGGLVRMWRRFSGHCYVDNEKIDLCVVLWERRHWLP
ncbi:hypothetical protein PHMEG_00031290, partial [Phytophthora megakarya]